MFLFFSGYRVITFLPPSVHAGHCYQTNVGNADEGPPLRFRCFVSGAGASPYPLSSETPFLSSLRTFGTPDARHFAFLIEQGTVW